MTPPTDIHSYWDHITSHAPAALRVNTVWAALQKQITDRITSLSTDAAGTEEGILWLATLQMPESLGLVDGSEYDTFRAMVIAGLQKVLADQGHNPVVLPAEAPVAAAYVQRGMLRFAVGGSNRPAEAVRETRAAQRTAAAKLDSTGACKQALAAHFSGKGDNAHPTNWKRIRKVSDGPEVGRVFQSRSTGEFATTINTLEGIQVIEGNLFPPADPAFIERLKAAAKEIEHNGDYGHLFWNERAKIAWLCLGDGDSYEGIEDLLQIPGVNSVRVEDEHNPDLTDGFVPLGTVGKIVSGR